MPVKQPESCIPGLRKKICRRHAIEKVMLFYGCVLLPPYLLYRLSDRVPELVDNVIEREDARGEIRDVAVRPDRWRGHRN